MRYDAVNAILLNELLKEHHQVQELKATAAQHDKEIKALTANLKEQESQIQKVTRLRRVDLSKPAPQMVLNYR